MTLTGTQLQTLASELQTFQNNQQLALNALQQYVASGTIIYNDANLPVAFPTTYTAFKTALAAASTAINTFLGTFPTIPSL